MKRFSVALMIVLFTAPVFAATHVFDLEGFAIRVNPNSSGGSFTTGSTSQPLDLRFRGDLGWGVGANLYLGNTLSLELTGSEVRPKANLSGLAGVAGNDNRLRMIPLTAVAQWHLLGGNTIDPYVGAGGAYFLFSDVRGSTGNTNLDRINFKSDVGLALNAGIKFGITKGLAIFADGKYVPLRSRATAVFVTGPNSETRVKINPVMVSAGVALRF